MGGKKGTDVRKECQKSGALHHGDTCAPRSPTRLHWDLDLVGKL